MMRKSVFFCVLEDKMQKLGGVGRYFTPSSKGKKCPSLDIKTASDTIYFDKMQQKTRIKM